MHSNSVGRAISLLFGSSAAAALMLLAAPLRSCATVLLSPRYTMSRAAGPFTPPAAVGGRPLGQGVQLALFVLFAGTTESVSGVKGNGVADYPGIGIDIPGV